MARDSSGFSDCSGLPLKRKSLQDLPSEAELVRQCSTGTSGRGVGQPAAWLHNDDLDSSRMAPKARTEAPAATASAAAATAAFGIASASSAAVASGPQCAGTPMLSARETSSSVASQLRGAAGPACSVSVYCSSSFGAMDQGGDQESESPMSCSGAEVLARLVLAAPRALGEASAAKTRPSLSGGSGCWERPHWADMPDDVFRKVLDSLPPSYLRVVRLVCRQWERAAARLLRHLRPETLEGVELSRRFPHLHSLDLSQCMAAVEFAAPKRLRLQSCLTDNLLSKLAGLRKLRELSLRNCNSLTGTGLAHLQSLPHLRVLNLSNCSRLTDEGLGCISQLPQLDTLNLQGCSSITDLGLTRLWGMQHLGHVVCHNGITDMGLRILTGIQALERVVLRECRGVSTQGVMALLQMPALKRVIISRCPQVTLEALCGVSNLRVVQDLAALTSAAAIAAGAAAPAPAGEPAGDAALPGALQQQQLLLPPAQWQHHHLPALMPDFHLLLADLG